MSSVLLPDFKYQDIYNKAQEFAIIAVENEGFEWDDAEALIGMCRKISQTELATLPEITDILKHCDENSDWDCGVIGNAFGEIAKELEKEAFATHINALSEDTKLIVDAIRTHAESHSEHLHLLTDELESVENKLVDGMMIEGEDIATLFAIVDEIMVDVGDAEKNKPWSGMMKKVHIYC